MNIMQLLQHNRKTHHVFLLIILVLSAYVHLWNPVGFPDINFDEGIYMRRAMNTLETGNPQEIIFMTILTLDRYSCRSFNCRVST